MKLVFLNKSCFSTSSSQLATNLSFSSYNPGANLYSIFPVIGSFHTSLSDIANSSLFISPPFISIYPLVGFSPFTSTTNISLLFRLNQR